MNTENTKICTNCGKPIREGDAFCANCGNAVKQSETPSDNCDKTTQPNEVPCSNSDDTTQSSEVISDNGDDTTQTSEVTSSDGGNITEKNEEISVNNNVSLTEKIKHLIGKIKDLSKNIHIDKSQVFAVCGIIAVIATVIIVLSTVCFHTWEPATCTTPTTCTKCNKTKQDTLGHDFLAATCTDPQICSRCKTTQGEALGHTVDKWESVAVSTCTVKGKDEGFCTRCNATVSKEADLKPHTEGKWEVTKEPTAAAKGEKSMKCTVCGKVIKTEAYTLSPEQIEKNYKAKCTTYSYDKIARSPESYEGKYAKIYGKVLQVMQEKFLGKIYYNLRIGTGGSYYYDDVVYVTYIAETSAPRILEDDMVTVYGKLDGEYTYETVRGDEITIPDMVASYVD